MTIDEKLDFFTQQLTCDQPVYTWQYDAEGNLLKSNCPDEAVLNTAFALFGCKAQMYAHAAESALPVLLGAPIGLSWLAAFEKEGDVLRRAVVLGPVFYRDVSLDGILRILRAQESISLAWQMELRGAVERTPVVSPLVTMRLVIMLHYALTGEKIMFSDITAHTETELREGRPIPKDRHKVWLAEQKLMWMVREGNLDFKSAQNDAGTVSAGVPLRSDDPTRQAKTSTIVFISLCVRAAIEGGLSPEQAYSLGDSYIQATESSRSITEISSINATMYEDFIRRVHNCRTDPDVSGRIRDCCDYIELHIEEKLALAALAARAGYTEYYFSRKFKEETGLSVNSYIRIAKIERAKLLLATTDADVQEVADRLSFCSRSYFGEAFRRVAGMSPSEYREQMRNR